MKTALPLQDNLSPIRMLRIDYAPDFSVIKELDLEDVARRVKEDWCVNCEWIVGTIGFDGLGYQTTFDAEGFEKYPGLEDFDYLRSYVPYAHKYGISVVAYLNMHWYDNKFASRHPDWEQVISDGRKYGQVNPLYGEGRTMCVNSPWRDWAFDLIEQAMKTGIDGVFLDGPVVFPDSCYCRYCQEIFKDRYGELIPNEDWSNELWKEFVLFREESLANFLRDARKRVKKVKRDGVIFLNSGTWSPASWRIARDIQKLNPFQDICGAEAFFHYGEQHYEYSQLIAGKYLRAGKKRTVVFTHYMNGKWHYLNLPPKEVKREISHIASAGVNHWFATLKPSLEYQIDSSKPVREMFEFLDRNEEYYRGASSVSDVGMLFSSDTGRFWLSREEGVYKEQASTKEENLIVNFDGKETENWSERKRLCEIILMKGYMGYFRALTRGHILFDIILDEDIKAEMLSKYRALVLPEAACLSKEMRDCIKDYVRDGGNLLASFEAGFYDERGNRITDLFELLGIESVEGVFPVVTGENYIRIEEGHFGLIEGSLIERGSYALKVRAEGSRAKPAMFMNPIERVYVPLNGVSEYPAVIVGNYGKGKVIYFPEAIGHFAETQLMPTAENRIVGALQSLIDKQSVRVEAPKRVSVEVFEQPEKNRMMVHLVNDTVDGYPATEFLPVRDIRIFTDVSREIGNVYRLREDSGVSVSADGIVTVSELEIYDVVVIEFR